MSQNSSEEISVQRVFDEISKYLKNEQLYERLLNILHEEVCIISIMLILSLKLLINSIFTALSFRTE